MRIYFDENFSLHIVQAFAVLQDGRKSEDIQVFSVEEAFGKGCPDETWIPGIARQHGVVITQDTNIHRTRAQWELCKSNKIGIFFFVPSRSRWNYWIIAELLFKWWPEIKEATKNQARPFGRAISASRSKWEKL